MKASPAFFIVVHFIAISGCKEDAPGVFTYHGQKVDATIVAEFSSAAGNSRIVTPLPSAEDEESLHRNLTPIIGDLYSGLKPGESVIVSIEMAQPGVTYSWGGRYTVKRLGDGRYTMSEPIYTTTEPFKELDGPGRQMVAPTNGWQVCVRVTINGLYSRWPDGFMGIANSNFPDSPSGSKNDVPLKR